MISKTAFLEKSMMTVGGGWNGKSKYSKGKELRFKMPAICKALNINFPF